MQISLQSVVQIAVNLHRNVSFLKRPSSFWTFQDPFVHPNVIEWNVEYLLNFSGIFLNVNLDDIECNILHKF